ncbi:MAG: tetratricopeptide repeat protein [Myxococcota bacterium]
MKGRQNQIAGARPPKNLPRRLSALGLAACTALACAGNPDKTTLASLRNQAPDLTEAPIDDGIDQAMAGYRKFLEEAPASSLTPEAMRRLADLQLEKEYGILGGPGATTERRTASAGNPASALAAPERASGALKQSGRATPAATPAEMQASGETNADFEARASALTLDDFADPEEKLALPNPDGDAPTGPLEAIALYDQILERYPNYAQADQVLYQKARAYDELGQVDEAIEVANELVSRFPDSRHLDEAQFRRGEYYFTRKKFLDAEASYLTIVEMGPNSSYYELALYKLGWTFYKQMLLPEALDTYRALLDHKVATNYDFDQVEDEAAQRRVTDTFRVMSLCFSDLGGTEAITSFFEKAGPRNYEHRVYRNLGEFYLEKLRYADAASIYEAFVDLYPIHQQSPRFSMRVIEIYETGGFPKLVVDAKKRFALSYALDTAYWQTFAPNDAPEIVDALASNLQDLATHYHALYQAPERPEDKPGHFTESVRWYRGFLASFPAKTETPALHYRLADLYLENQDWAVAATEYEQTAYAYPAHERSSDAGYAAIFAHREHEKTLPLDEIQTTSNELPDASADDVPATPTPREQVQRAAIASTLRFVEHFPDHEHAPAVLGAAIDDLFGLSEYARAIEVGHQLIEAYPDADSDVRRGAWTVVAHASFETEAYAKAELAYVEVLTLLRGTNNQTTVDEISNNLAAAIYKQGEIARDTLDHRAAADHFLRIAAAAPQSEIRPIAEFDASAALIALEDFKSAAEVLEAFRNQFPSHELAAKSTQQLAYVYRADAQLGRAAAEYVRVAQESENAELRRESLLLAAELYEEAELFEAALRVYQSFVTQFTEPLEPAVVARSKMVTLFQKTDNETARQAMLREIVEIDRRAGPARTDLVRVHAGRAALTLSEEDFNRFTDVALTLPFDKSLEKKKKRMDQALRTFEALLDYQVGEITAAATFHIAEIYGDFSRALLASERPMDLSTNDLDEYEMVLEEEAYPFEEKSINVHEKNLELMGSGVYNRWIERSLAELAEVMPGRYAKFDARPGPLTSLARYVYETPRSLMAPVADEPIGELADAAAAAQEEEEGNEAPLDASEPESAGESTDESIPAAMAPAPLESALNAEPVDAPPAALLDQGDTP